MVIRRRLADHYRRTVDRHTVPWSDLEVQDEDGNAANPTLDRVARLHWQQQQEQRERRREIEEYGAVLAHFGVTFDALTHHVPKHRGAQERTLTMAYYLASQPHLVHVLRRQRMLPLQDLTRTFGCSRKAVERHRAFIIAATLVLLHDWPYLREYVPPLPASRRGPL
ncbi:MAG: hypothetical protein ACP5QO_01060 [Clostridia bacterium]